MHVEYIKYQEEENTSGCYRFKSSHISAYSNKIKDHRNRADRTLSYFDAELYKHIMDMSSTFKSLTYSRNTSVENRPPSSPDA